MPDSIWLTGYDFRISITFLALSLFPAHAVATKKTQTTIATNDLLYISLPTFLLYKHLALLFKGLCITSNRHRFANQGKNGHEVPLVAPCCPPNISTTVLQAVV